MNKIYNASSIKILKGLKAIRKRPGMYIGNTSDGTGLHRLFFEVLDNSIDEYLEGYCNKIYIKIYKDNSISIEDNGRGIPIDIKLEDENDIKRSAAEIVMTELHSGGKFNQKSYKISGGLHGIGLSCVNGLSKKLILKVFKNGKKYFIKFLRGKAQDVKIIKINNILTSPMKIIGNSKKNGTRIRFWPDNKIFKNIKYKYNIILERIRELSFLNNGIKIILINQKKNTKEIFFYKSGTEGFVKFINKKKYIHKTILKMFLKKKIKNKSNIIIDLSMQWNKSYKEKILCFTNNIYQKDGGIHLTSLKSSITHVINKYIKNKNLSKKKIKINSEDIRQGLTCILSIKIPEPKFSSQTKDKLISNEVKLPIKYLINKNLLNFLKNNSIEAKIICNKIIKSAKIRDFEKKIRDSKRKKNNFEKFNILSKLSDCQEKNPKISEIYIVEGDSAGGSAKQARDRKFQAVLPLRGKILNVEKSKLYKILASEQINILATALQFNINKKKDIKKLRYHKIIIMTDADIDGSHIKTLILTFLFKYMFKLIKKGYIYIAQPPLYRIIFKKKNFYFKNEKETFKFILNIAIKKSKIIPCNKNLPIIKKKKLKNLINFYIKIKKSFNFLSKKINIKILKLIINGLNIKINNNLETDKTIIKIKEKFKNNKIYIKKRYNTKKNNYEILINDILNKNNKNTIIDNEIIKKSEYKFLLKSFKYLNKIINGDMIIYFNNNKKKFYQNDFNKIINWLILQVNKIITKQRYKGLGEMNPEQLWETTMDPNKRSLLKVIIKNLKKTKETFSMLMGGDIKKRKSFFKNKLKIKY